MKAYFAIYYISFAIIKYVELRLKNKGYKMSPAAINEALSSVKIMESKLTDINFSIAQESSTMLI